MRRGPGTLYRRVESLRFLATRDRRAAIEFSFAQDLPEIPIRERLSLIGQFLRVTQAVRGYHTLTEMLSIAHAILERKGRSPTVLEAGCGYGASTAKLSLATRLASGSLIACDSFRGMPENDERHELMDGRATEFRAGAFRGTLGSVKRTVEKWGAIEVCRFEKGPFEDTLPLLPRESALDVVVLDVDLVASTRVSVRELWPRLRLGGVLFSLDGQLRATHQLLSDGRFWRDEVGVEPPVIEGLNASKLLSAIKSRGVDPHKIEVTPSEEPVPGRGASLPARGRRPRLRRRS